MDLTEVEGLADLINAETEAQRKQALMQSDGCLSKLYNRWRTTLLRNIAHLEAYIDFSEDQNIEDNVFADLNASLIILEEEIRDHLNDNRVGERLRNGVKTVIVGEPNVGKSSFINLICQKSISIVTNIAGTTRDIIESNYIIGGYPIILADTAGLRPNVSDIVEKEGINRAMKYAKEADLMIILMDSVSLLREYKLYETEFNFEQYKNHYLKNLGLKEADSIRKIFIMNKSDLIDDCFVQKLNEDNITMMSCTENKGVEIVLNALKSNLSIL